MRFETTTRSTSLIKKIIVSIALSSESAACTKAAMAFAAPLWLARSNWTKISAVKVGFTEWRVQKKATIDDRVGARLECEGGKWNVGL